MESRIKRLNDNTSTPKRRRLGTGRILKPSLRLIEKENNEFSSKCSPIHRQISAARNSSGDRCESPPLPSNQNEFLHDSRSRSSDFYIPCSPAVLNDSANAKDHWDSLSNSDVRDLCKSDISTQEIINEIKDISDDMFHSRLEHDSTILSEAQLDLENVDPPVEKYISVSVGNEETHNELCSLPESILPNLKSCSVSVFDKPLKLCGFEENYKQDVDESFQLVNQSICGIEDDKTERAHKSALFETKDSFLLDIQESGIVPENHNSNIFVKPLPLVTHCDNSFYGLPLLVRDLFKTYRNIEKFYDWQEECLNLKRA
ncbi:hypothetical protein ACJJTC_014006 [Scirpophaga incertulas]